MFPILVIQLYKIHRTFYSSKGCDLSGIIRGDSSPFKNTSSFNQLQTCYPLLYSSEINKYCPVWEFINPREDFIKI